MSNGCVQITVFEFHLFDMCGSCRGKKKNPASASHKYTNDQRSRGLMWAASENNRTRAMHLLLMGCDINGADYDARTALHLAASSGHLDMVKYLVANGADVDLKDRFNNTPLDDAKREKFRDIVAFLEKRRGAQPLQGRNPCLIALGSPDGRSITTNAVLDAIEKVGVERKDQRIVNALKKYPKVRPRNMQHRVHTPYQHRIITSCWMLSGVGAELCWLR